MGVITKRSRVSFGDHGSVLQSIPALVVQLRECAKRH